VTAERSLARLLLGKKALVTVREFSPINMRVTPTTTSPMPSRDAARNVLD
jgi:hypothetical protein